MSADGAPRRGAIARWAGELALGMRLSVTGGRSGLARLVMIGLGVGLGAAMLLIAASVPTMVAAYDTRAAARDVDWGRRCPGAATPCSSTGPTRSTEAGRSTDGW
ncbi:hypothetical protein [Thermocatellispora tengchongensis]|uniref:hypothetical protein n=1 Tax=Thermocatellispora tengchongensis TaxID=1073253 RepID=UPI003640AD82